MGAFEQHRSARRSAAADTSISCSPARADSSHPNHLRHHGRFRSSVSSMSWVRRGRLAAGDHRRGAGVGEAINPSPLVSE
jgi:hypothetical protein